MTESTNDAPQRRWWLWGSIGVLVLLVAAAIVWAVVAPRSESAEPTGSPTASTSPSSTPSGSPSPSGSVSPVPTPGASSTSSPIPPELPPVAPTKSVKDTDGVVVSLTKIEAVTGEAVAPGEISGPALRITVKLTNDTDEELTLRYTAVNLYYGADRIPASPIIKPGGDPFYGEVKSGKSAIGVYVFSVPKDQRKDVTVGVDYKPGQPTVIFKGDFS